MDRKSKSGEEGAGETGVFIHLSFMPNVAVLIVATCLWGHCPLVPSSFFLFLAASLSLSGLPIAHCVDFFSPRCKKLRRLHIINGATADADDANGLISHLLRRITSSLPLFFNCGKATPVNGSEYISSLFFLFQFMVLVGLEDVGTLVCQVQIIGEVRKEMFSLNLWPQVCRAIALSLSSLLAHL